MKTQIQFTTFNKILAWYVILLDDSNLHSMPQETNQEATKLALDIEAGNVEIIDLGNGIFWYMRNP